MPSPRLLARSAARWLVPLVGLIASGVCAQPVDVTSTPLYSLVRSMPENTWAKANQNPFSDAWVPAQWRTLYTWDTNPTPSKIIWAWSGFAWDSARGDLILWGGGHANYAGNEIYRWRSSTLRWERGSLPSDKRYLRDAFFNAIDGPDAAPVSTHTYDNNTYLPVVDRFITFGGAAYQNGGPWYRWTDATQTDVRPTGPYFWDPELADPMKVGGTTGSHPQHSGAFPEILGGYMWTNRDLYRDFPNMPINHVNGCVQPTVENGRDVVYIASAARSSTAMVLSKWTVDDDPAADTLERVGGYYTSASGQITCALWPRRKLFVYTAAGSQPLRFWDLTTPGPTNPNRVVANAGLEPLIDGLAARGMAITHCAIKFDPVRENVLAWCGDAGLWRIIPPPSNTTTGWSVQALQGGGTPPAPVVGTGILGKWRYAPGFDVFVGLMDTNDGSVWVYKPHGWVDPAIGSPPPNQPPTLAPSASPPSAEVGVAVTFAANAADTDGTIAAVDWLFGDGVQMTGAAVTRTFAAAGVYTAQATVRDDDGAVATATVNVTISDPPPAGTTEVRLQQGRSGYAGAEDTYLDRYLPATARGASGLFYVDGTHYAPLLRFAVFRAEGGPVPDGADIVTAELQLYKRSIYDHAYRLQPVLVPWRADQATWNQRLAGVPWSVAGAKGAGTDVADGEDARASVGWDPAAVAFDVTARLRTWSTQAATGALRNHGWRLTYASGDWHQARYDSSEAAVTDAQRPALVVKYRSGGTANAPPSVSASASPSSTKVGRSIAFTASASDPDGTIAAIDWTFGNGATASGASVAHAYATAGAYRATVTVRDNGGATATSSVDVVVAANQAPSVSITATPTTVDAGQSVGFTASAADPDGTIASIQWTFGDGATASGATASHAYATAGSYVAQVTVTDDDGATASRSVTIDVRQPPPSGTPVTLRLEQGRGGYAGAQDTYLDRYAPATVRNGSALLNVDASFFAPLVRFAVFQAEGGPVPDGAHIASATVELYKRGAYDHVYRLQRLRVPWSAAQATWNQRLAGVPWTVAGAKGAGSDVDGQEDAQASVGWDPAVARFDVTARVQAWSAQAAAGTLQNHGWRLTYVSGDWHHARYDSSESTLADAQRPALVVTYLLP